MQTLARLSVLTRLCLASSSSRAPQMIGCEELACLRSSKLQDLDVSLRKVRDALTLAGTMGTSWMEISAIASSHMWIGADQGKA